MLQVANRVCGNCALSSASPRDSRMRLRRARGRKSAGVQSILASCVLRRLMARRTCLLRLSIALAHPPASLFPTHIPLYPRGAADERAWRRCVFEWGICAAIQGSMQRNGADATFFFASAPFGVRLIAGVVCQVRVVGRVRPQAPAYSAWTLAILPTLMVRMSASLAAL